MKLCYYSLILTSCKIVETITRGVCRTGIYFENNLFYVKVILKYLIDAMRV